MNKDTYEILTPSGWQPFAGIRRTKREETLAVELEGGESLQCTPEHLVKTKDHGFVEAQNLSSEHLVETANGFNPLESKLLVEGDEYVYDLIEVEGGNEYFTDGIVSHNCQFLGSQNTLIPYRVLQSLYTMEPIDGATDNTHLDVFEEPKKGRTYFMTVDTARGFGGDYSAFLVYDITQMPFKVVAKYRNNRISTLLYPNVIYNTATHYNDCEVLVEINDAGGEIVNKLYYDLEYENILMTSKDQGKMMLGGFGTNAIHGLRTTKQTKSIGCANAKLLIEKKKLEIRDVDIIEELNNFVEHKDSYAADEGCNDDLAMNLVLFSWAATQDYFKQNYDMDIRKRFEEEEILREEASLMPFGFIESGAYDEVMEIEEYAEIREARGFDPNF